MNKPRPYNGTMRIRDNDGTVGPAITVRPCDSDAASRGQGTGGLYFGRGGWIQKLQEGAYALGPGGFVVFGAFYAFVVEVLTLAPAFFQEEVAELFYVGDDLGTFAGADVEPDAWAGMQVGSGGKAQDYALIPPDRGGERGNFAEGLRVFETDI